MRWSLIRCALSSFYSEKMLPRRPKYLTQPPGTFEYVVQEKDSLRSLAATYDVNLSLLKRVNKLMSDVIFPDQVLYIPNAEYDMLNRDQDQMGMKPGHAQRMGMSPKDGYIAPPRPLSNNEIKKIDEECHHKFIKIQASYLTASDEEIPGVLLVTPDGVMFDPDPSNSIVKERGAEEFQMVDSIMSVISVTIYHNDEILKSPLNESTLSKGNDNEKSCDEESAKENLEPKHEQEKTSELDKSQGNLTENLEEKLDGSIDKLDSTSISAPSTPVLCEENRLKVYLKLKVHKNIHALKTFKVEGKIRGVTRLDHWFAIPLDNQVDQLYAFFKRWTPSMANTSDSDENNFVQVESDSQVAGVIDDSTDLSGEVSLKKKPSKHVLVKDWEIVSIREYRRLLAVVEIKKLPLPDLSEPSRILKESQVAMLACNLPAMMEGLSWNLIYSTENHGFSLNTLYRKIAKIDSAVLLIIEDTSDNVFGAMIVGQLKVSDHFLGCGESYLFTFYPEFKRFNWTGINNYFVKCSLDSLVIGASEGNNGLWFDADLYHGRTQVCQTFDNELLTSTEDFVVKCLEAWSFK